MACLVYRVPYPESIQRSMFAILYLPPYLPTFVCLTECSHIPNVHSYIGFRREELQSRGVTFRLGLDGIFHDPSCLSSFHLHLVFLVLDSVA